MTCQSVTRQGIGLVSAPRIARQGRTGTVLAPDSNGSQVSSTERTRLEQLVEGTPERAPAHVHLRPRLPHVVVRVLQGLLGEDGALPKEASALRAAQALIEDLQQVRESVRRVDRHVRVRSCRNRASAPSRIARRTAAGTK